MAMNGDGRLAARNKITGYFTAGSGGQTKALVNDNRENASVVSRPGKSLAVSGKEENMPRKHLQTLQSSVPNGLTRPGDKKPKNIKFIPNQPGVVNVFIDPQAEAKPATVTSKIVQEDKCTVTDPDITNCRCGELEPVSSAEEEALHLMGSGPVPEEYWKDIAERRREALSEALEENEQLHTSIHELQAENERLNELAEQAEYFASVLKTLTQDDEKTEKEPSDGKEETTESEEKSDEDEHNKESESKKSPEKTN